jgi:hypothetical protein
MQFVADSEPRLAAACRGAEAGTGVGVLRVDLPSVGSDPEDPRMPGALHATRASGNAQEISTGDVGQVGDSTIRAAHRISHSAAAPPGQHRSSVRDPARQAKIVVDI